MKNAPLVSMFIGARMISSAVAADVHHPEQTPQAANERGMPMMAMVQQMMGGGLINQCGRVEGTLAFIRTESHLDDTQSVVWNALAGDDLFPLFPCASGATRMRMNGP